MRLKGSKSRYGNKVRCPKCKYQWKTKQAGYICCSRCKRYFRLEGKKNVNQKK